MVYNKRQYRKCQKCEWEWVANKESLQCPNCHTFNWKDSLDNWSDVETQKAIKSLEQKKTLKKTVDELNQMKNRIDTIVKKIIGDM